MYVSCFQASLTIRFTVNRWSVANRPWLVFTQYVLCHGLVCYCLEYTYVSILYAEERRQRSLSPFLYIGHMIASSHPVVWGAYLMPYQSPTTFKIPSYSWSIKQSPTTYKKFWNMGRARDIHLTQLKFIKITGYLPQKIFIYICTSTYINLYMYAYATFPERYS